MGWFRKQEIPAWFVQFKADLKAFAAALPEQARAAFEEDEKSASLWVHASSLRHRDFYVEAHIAEFEFGVGKLWTEGIEPTEENARYLLAVCDAVRDGRWREARDRDSGLIYHVYRLRSRGYNGFYRDSEYSMRHYLRQKVRRVAIDTPPPLGAR